MKVLLVLLLQNEMGVRGDLLGYFLMFHTLLYETRCVIFSLVSAGKYINFQNWFSLQ